MIKPNLKLFLRHLSSKILRITKNACPDILIDHNYGGFNGLLRVSLFAAVEFLFLILVFPLTFEVSDDFLMNTIASGAMSGIPSEFLVFTNVLIGKFLKSMYTLLPQINWYTVYMLGALFIGYVVIQFTFYRLKADFSIRIMRHILIFACLFYALHTSGFTLVSSVVALAGFLLILTSKRHSYLDLIGGMLLIILASLIRHHIFYMFTLLAMPLVLINFLHRNYIQTIAAIAAIVISLGAINYDRVYYSNHAEYFNYRSDNSLRARLYTNDNRFCNIENVHESLVEIEWDEGNFNMVARNLYDVNNHNFSKENLLQVVPKKRALHERLQSDQITDSLKDTVRSFWDYVTERYYFFTILMLLTIMLLWFRRSKLISVVLFCLYVILVAFYLYHFKDGNLKPRVLFGMILAPVFLILFYLDEYGNIPKRIAFLNGVKVPYSRILLINLAMVTLVLTIFIHQQNTLFTFRTRDRVHEYLNFIEIQKHDFYAQRIVCNPYYIYKNPPDQSKAYSFGWLIGSPFNKGKIETYTCQENIDIYSIKDQDIIWYFGERLFPTDAPIVEAFYRSNYPQCQVTKDTILVAETYNLYRYTFFIPSEDSLATVAEDPEYLAHPHRAETVQAAISK